MRFSLFANLAAIILFATFTAFSEQCRWEVLVFQLILQLLTNEFWIDIFRLPFKGQQLFGVEQNKLADMRRVRRVARWTAAFLLLFPALVFVALGCINYWGGGALEQALHVPLNAKLIISSLAAQGVIFTASLIGGLVPLSYRTVIEALMARHERRLMAEGRHPSSSAAPVYPPPPTHAGVDMLPHGLPAGVALPACLNKPQRCSPLHSHHAKLVYEKLREDELAILSTSPAGLVALPSSSNERFFGGLGLCLAATLLYTAIGLFEDDTSRVITRWVVILLGLAMLPISIHVLRASARRQALLRRTDYFITNRRLHICRSGSWGAVNLASMEVVVGGSYGEGRGDVDLCPESGSETYNLVNVEHAEEICTLLERLIYMENAR